MAFPRTLRTTTWTIALLLGMAMAPEAPAATPTALQLLPQGTATIPTAAVGGDSVADEEIDEAMDSGDADSGDGEGDLGDKDVVNRGLGHARGNGGGPAPSAKRAKSNPEVVRSFEGVNFHDQRFSNNGNQFSVEPPDQALCVGNGFVVESVNDVLRVYNTAGTLLAGPVDLNTFYGYAPAVTRTAVPTRFGPSITDPSCYYDADTQRWFHVVLTLDRANPFTQGLAGTNHLDIAVSQTSNPLGAWKVYQLPVQNNGTQGTPNHQCNSGFCLGDYPHIGADANAIFLTTNEFALSGPGFYGAQIYAISKRALAAWASSPNVVMWNGGSPDIPAPAFTVWPAISPDAQYAVDNGGTEFLLNTDAVFFDDDASSEVWLWAITNTSAIDSSPLSLALNVRPLAVQAYAVPARTADQKPGNTPLHDCIASAPCAALVGSAVSTAPQRRVAVNDSRTQQVTYANGKLWGAWDTDVLQGTVHRSGIAYLVVNPNSGVIFANGTLSLDGANLTYPAVAVTKSGRGVIGFSLVGPTDWPSAAYASIDAKLGVGDVHIAAAGVGPWDGFTGYSSIGGSRARWGDYGAAVADGNSIWLASEYIAQTCTFAQYNTTVGFGQCGGTRGSLGNWSTRITQLVP
jgi:hypothetical protein